MMRSFQRGGLTLSFRDEGSGPALVFQHGLGADAGQTFEIIGGFDGFRRITLECRGHGGSDLGPAEALSIATFANDLIALVDHLDIPHMHLGGISMGAAIAARVAADHPLRVRSLCLARPAWFDCAGPPNMAIFAELAAQLAAHGVVEGRKRFMETDAYRALHAASPDNAASLLGQFDRDDPLSTQALLSRIARDGPGLSRAEYEALKPPFLVLGNDHDVVHPLAMAKDVAACVDGARFTEIPSKADDRAAHVDAFQTALHGFVTRAAADGAGPRGGSRAGLMAG